MAPGFKRRAEAEVAVGAVRVPGGSCGALGMRSPKGISPLDGRGAVWGLCGAVGAAPGICGGGGCGGDPGV